jgi:hypothetical protein
MSFFGVATSWQKPQLLRQAIVDVRSRRDKLTLPSARCVLLTNFLT